MALPSSESRQDRTEMRKITDPFMKMIIYDEPLDKEKHRIHIGHIPCTLTSSQELNSAVFLELRH